MMANELIMIFDHGNKKLGNNSSNSSESFVTILVETRSTSSCPGGLWVSVEPSLLASLKNGTVIALSRIAALRHGFGKDRWSWDGSYQATHNDFGRGAHYDMRSLEHDTNGRPAVAIYGAWAKFCNVKELSRTNGCL
jgi:hypothetical protein